MFASNLECLHCIAPELDYKLKMFAYKGTEGVGRYRFEIEIACTPINVRGASYFSRRVFASAARRAASFSPILISRPRSTGW